MAGVEVSDSAGAIVWRSPDVEQTIVEVVERVVRVTDFNTGLVVATYALKAGEQLVRSEP